MDANVGFEFKVPSGIGSQIKGLSNSSPHRQAGKISTFTASSRKTRLPSVGFAPIFGIPLDVPERYKVTLLVIFSAALALLLLAVVGWVFAQRWGVKKRTRVYLVPNESFDPSPQAIEQFASALMRTRKLGVPKASSATRVLLESHGDGQMSYALEFPSAAAAAISTGGFAKVARVDPDPDTGQFPTADGVL